MQPRHCEDGMLVAGLPDGCGVVNGVERPCGQAVMVDCAWLTKALTAEVMGVVTGVELLTRGAPEMVD